MSYQTLQYQIFLDTEYPPSPSVCVDVHMNVSAKDRVDWSWVRLERIASR